MISIEEHHVDAMASNAGAIRNGRGLASKGQYSALCVSDDGTIMFGRCDGSRTYDCSVDFADPAKPVPRCSCPSRQIPCKHCLGLLYAWTGDASRFAKAVLPEELAAKRETAAKRAAAKKTATPAARKKAARKTSAGALRKKLEAQSAALELLDTVLADLLVRGLGTHGRREAEALREQAAMLRAAWLPGAELALLRLSAVAARSSEAVGAGREGAWHDAMDELARLETLARRGKDYLAARIADPALAPDTDSAIAAWLGHAWQYDELVAAGREDPAAELVQLAFFVVDDGVKREYADTGVWMHLGDGRLFHTETLRPYKAVDHVKADDSDYDVAKVTGFVRYPGDAPERVRWRAREHRSVEAGDLAIVRGAASADFAAVLKSIRGALKSPLGARHPLALLRPARCGAIEGEEGVRYAIEDAAGVRIELADARSGEVVPTTELLPLVGNQVEGAALLCRFHFDPVTLRLAAQPLTFVQDGSMTRLAG